MGNAKTAHVLLPQVNILVRVMIEFARINQLKLELEEEMLSC